MTAGDEAGRPQDQGRRHRRRAAPGPETRALLDRYQVAMRRELGGLLDELEPKPSAQLTVDGSTPSAQLSIAERQKRWTLAVQLARELGSAIDPMPEPSSTPAGKPGAGGPRRARARDFGGT